MTKSPGSTSLTPVADRLDGAGGFVAEQERELVVDAALPVVQIGVAHAAGLDRNHDLARPWVGHDDGDDFDGSAR